MRPSVFGVKARGVVAKIAAIVLACLALSAFAGEARPWSETEEERFNAVASELRCLVCQNESLASSNAELARDLRREIRTMIQAGKSDAEIMEFMVERYGDFVRYRPPFKADTLLLWFGPALLFAIGLGGLFVRLRRRVPADPPLSEAERGEAERLLRDGP